MAEPPVYVLGMHRSGTSLFMGLLHGCGLNLGENLMPTTAANPKGYFENTDVYEVHENLFEKVGCDWINPPQLIDWTTYDSSPISAAVENIAHDRPWGIKDPRLLFLLDGHLPYAESIRFVGIFRHPLSVARSIEARDGIPIEVGLEIWRVYNERLHLLCKSLGFPLVEFGVNAESVVVEARRTCDALGLTWSEETGRKLADASLIHHHARAEQTKGLPTNIADLYRTLRRLSGGEANRVSIARDTITQALRDAQAIERERTELPFGPRWLHRCRRIQRAVLKLRPEPDSWLEVYPAAIFSPVPYRESKPPPRCVNRCWLNEYGRLSGFEQAAGVEHGLFLLYGVASRLGAFDLKRLLVALQAYSSPDATLAMDVRLVADLNFKHHQWWPTPAGFTHSFEAPYHHDRYGLLNAVDGTGWSAQTTTPIELSGMELFILAPQSSVGEPPPQLVPPRRELGRLAKLKTEYENLRNEAGQRGDALTKDLARLRNDVSEKDHALSKTNENLRKLEKDLARLRNEVSEKH